MAESESKFHHVGATINVLQLQRDYRLAKEMEVLPGFSWDHNTHRLSASPEAWMNAEKVSDPHIIQSDST